MKLGPDFKEEPELRQAVVSRLSEEIESLKLKQTLLQSQANNEADLINNEFQLLAKLLLLECIDLGFLMVIKDKHLFYRNFDKAIFLRKLWDIGVQVMGEERLEQGMQVGLGQLRSQLHQFAGADDVELLMPFLMGQVMRLALGKMEIIDITQKAIDPDSLFMVKIPRPGPIEHLSLKYRFQAFCSANGFRRLPIQNLPISAVGDNSGLEAPFFRWHVPDEFSSQYKPLMRQTLLFAFTAEEIEALCEDPESGLTRTDLLDADAFYFPNFLMPDDRGFVYLKIGNLELHFPTRVELNTGEIAQVEPGDMCWPISLYESIISHPGQCYVIQNPSALSINLATKQEQWLQLSSAKAKLSDKNGNRDYAQIKSLEQQRSKLIEGMARENIEGKDIENFYRQGASAGSPQVNLRKWDQRKLLPKFADENERQYHERAGWADAPINVLKTEKELADHGDWPFERVPVTTSVVVHFVDFYRALSHGEKQLFLKTMKTRSNAEKAVIMTGLDILSVAKSAAEYRQMRRAIFELICQYPDKVVDVLGVCHSLRMAAHLFEDFFLRETGRVEAADRERDLFERVLFRKAQQLIKGTAKINRLNQKKEAGATNRPIDQTEDFGLAAMFALASQAEDSERLEPDDVVAFMDQIVIQAHRGQPGFRLPDSDFQALKNLWRETYQAIDPKWVDILEQELSANLQNPNAEFTIVKHRDKFIGMVMVKKDFPKVGQFYVGNLYVANEFQGPFNVGNLLQNRALQKLPVDARINGLVVLGNDSLERTINLSGLVISGTHSEDQANGLQMREVWVSIDKSQRPFETKDRKKYPDEFFLSGHYKKHDFGNDLDIRFGKVDTSPGNEDKALQTIKKYIDAGFVGTRVFFAEKNQHLDLTKTWIVFEKRL